MHAHDQLRLSQLEGVIGRHARSYVEGGRALREIRDTSLYQDAFRTFEEYVVARWDMSRGHAYRLIDAASVVDACLQLETSVLPANEAQARELIPLYRDEGSDAVASVWASLLQEHGPAVTAAIVRDATRSRASAQPTWFSQYAIVRDRVEAIVRPHYAADVRVESAWDRLVETRVWNKPHLQEQLSRLLREAAANLLARADAIYTAAEREAYEAQRAAESEPEPVPVSDEPFDGLTVVAA